MFLIGLSLEKLQ